MARGDEVGGGWVAGQRGCWTADMSDKNVFSWGITMCHGICLINRHF